MFETNYDPKMAESVAEILLKEYTLHKKKIKLISINAAELVTWKSGWECPIYCDNRKLQSLVEEREIIAGFLATVVDTVYPDREALSSVANGATPHGVLTTSRLKIPHLNINKEEKDHGLKNAIEGIYAPGQNIVVLEDLVSTSSSSLHAVDVARAKKLNVLGMVCIVNYGFPIAQEAFIKAGCKLCSLTDYPTILEVGTRMELVKPDEVEMLSQWQKDPANWSKNRMTIN